MRRFAWVYLAVALAGCESGGAGNELGLCSTVCRCLTQLPGEQRACVDACVEGGVVANTSSACEECVFENASSCDDLTKQCSSVCRRSEPFPEGAGPDAF